MFLVLQNPSPNYYITNIIFVVKYYFYYILKFDLLSLSTYFQAPPNPIANPAYAAGSNVSNQWKERNLFEWWEILLQNVS